MSLSFDIERLSAWLGRHVSGFGSPIEVTQFAGGQSNPTYLVSSEGRRCVLRRKPSGPPLPSAPVINREYRVMAALADIGLPVPNVHALCDDTSVVGTAFSVMGQAEASLRQGTSSQMRQKS